MVKQKLGDLIKKERIRRDLSQSVLAERAHVSLRTISDIENYKGNPQFYTLCTLALYLNISLDEIVYSKENCTDSTMRQIISELDECPEEYKNLALSTLRGFLAGINNTKN